LSAFYLHTPSPSEPSSWCTLRKLSFLSGTSSAYRYSFPPDKVEPSLPRCEAYIRRSHQSSHPTLQQTTVTESISDFLISSHCNNTTLPLYLQSATMSCPLHNGSSAAPASTNGEQAIQIALEPIPQPPEYWFVGNLPEMDPAFPIRGMWRLMDIYGRIFKVNLLGFEVIAVSDYELINEVCDQDRFEKAIGNALEDTRALLKDGLFTAYRDEPVCFPTTPKQHQETWTYMLRRTGGKRTASSCLYSGPSPSGRCSRACWISAPIGSQVGPDGP
jgi:hypothetical protein